jgi:Mn2+/Fe2+ NRAMP family transporter
MFGTCVAVFDGYSRSMSATITILFKNKIQPKSKNLLYRSVLIIIALGSFIIIYLFQNDPKGFGKLVILATTISFLFAPIIAVFNVILVREKYVGKDFTPNVLMRSLSYLGIVFLILFTLFFIFQDKIIPYLP